MLTAGILRAPCTRCRQDLVHILESSLAGALASPRRAPTHSRQFHLPPCNLVPPRHRCFSTTRTSRQAPNATSTEPSILDRPRDLEEFVRQTKATFGDTLPRDYLTPEEYKIYERLFGPPLRETQPEDVGIPFQGETDVAPEDGESVKLEELEDGRFEEEVDEYATPDQPEDTPELVDGASSEFPIEAQEEAAVAEGDSPNDEDPNAFPIEPPLDPRLEYLAVTAKNSREYAALKRLQADFEAASLLAIQQAEAQEAAEAAEAATAAATEAAGQESYDAPKTPEQEQEGRAAAEYRYRMLEQWERHDDGLRVHPLTEEGRSRTYPSTIFLPQDSIVRPITNMLRRTDPVHLKLAAEEAFGGSGLPYSARIPPNMRNAKQQGIALEASHQRMSQINADAYMASVLPIVYASATSILVEVRKRLGTTWLRDLMAKNNGQGPRILDAGGAGAGLLAWQHVVDAEWEAMEAAGETGRVGRSRAPRGKGTALVGSDFLRHRVSELLPGATFMNRLPDYLHSAKNVEKLLDAPADPLPRKTYDVVIMGHMLMPLDRAHKRNKLLDNVWEMLNPDGGVLIVLEKGHPRGFEAIADVRSRLLHEFIVPPANTNSPFRPNDPEVAALPEQLEPKRIREPGMIVAPCTNHNKCPMYTIPGYKHGRKDFCRFEQRLVRPPFLQKLLDASHINHEDAQFSYIAVQRGGEAVASGGPLQGEAAAERAFSAEYTRQEGTQEEGSTQAPSMLSLPRNILSPLKGRHHVILDLCTPAGELERWTVPKSYGKQAYHDARKARWGDLWALGGKTRQNRRQVNSGPAAAVAEEERLSAAMASPSVVAANVMYPLGPPLKKAGDGGVRAREALEERLTASGKNKRSVVDLNVGVSGTIEGATERGGARSGVLGPERRTKGGRIVKGRDLLREMEGEDGEGKEEEEYDEYENDDDDEDLERWERNHLRSTERMAEEMIAELQRETRKQKKKGGADE